MSEQTLLLINKSQTVMALTKRILERAGYCVCCVNSLAGARVLFADFAPDGVILEKELPDGDGLEYCHELRKRSSLPIMFFSGDKDDELPALEAGASDFMKIPCNYDIMKARVNVMLNGNYKKSPPSCGDCAAPTDTLFTERREPGGQNVRGADSSEVKGDDAEHE